MQKQVHLKQNTLMLKMYWLSSCVKEPYPNKLFTISLDVINKPNAAGSDKAEIILKIYFVKY